MLTDQMIRIPKERWMSFSKRLEEAKLWGWESRYADSSVTDGTSWSLEAEWAGKKVRSTGQNAYPEGKQFRALITAIVELSHGQNFP